MENTPDETRVNLTAHDELAERLEQFKTIFPEVFTEGKLDIERLRQHLGDYSHISPERYGLNWAGKSDAIRALQTTSTGTLVPTPDESVKFDTSENLIIEGDNLEVLKLLQKGYYGKIKIIYIDPPYNLDGDFIYPDNFKEGLEDYLKYSGQVTDEGFKLSTNTEYNGRFHSKWLNMMYPRLFLAKNLLCQDGAIFVSIDDNEVHNLRCMMNEIFGEENFMAVFPWRKRTAKSDVPFGLSQDYEWVVSYTKGGFAAGNATERTYIHSDDYKEGWRLADLTTQRTSQERPNSAFTMVNPKNGDQYPVNPNRVWGVTTDTFLGYYNKGKIVFPGDYDFLNIKKPAYRVFENEDKKKNAARFGGEEAIKAVSTYLPKEIGRTEDGTKEITELFGAKLFPYPKPTSLVKFLIETTTDTDFIVLDFFAGSGTTADAVLQLNAQDNKNRKFICIQLPQLIDPNQEAYKAGYKNIAQLCRERVRRVIAKKESEQGNNLELEAMFDLGFKAFKLTSSNFKEWEPEKHGTSEEELVTQLRLLVENVKDQRNELDLVYEILLKLGYELSVSIEQLELAGQQVYSIADGEFLLSVEKHITAETLRAMMGRTPKPTRIMCLDVAFEGKDSLKTNIVLEMQTHNIEFHTV